MNDCGCTDGIKIAGLGIVDARLALRHYYDGFVFSQRVDQLNGTLPAHGKGQDGVRKKYGVSNWKYG